MRNSPKVTKQFQLPKTPFNVQKPKKEKEKKVLSFIPNQSQWSNLLQYVTQKKEKR